MTHQLRAQSISVQVSTRTKCIAHCKGCIAASTPNAECGKEEVVHTDPHQLRRGLMFAERCGATHAILTSKADPLQETPEFIGLLLRECAARMPVVDLHTNGWLLTSGSRTMPHDLGRLRDDGLSMLTVSVSHQDPEINREFMGGRGSRPDAILEDARRLGLLTRVSLLVHQEGVKDLDSIVEYIKHFGGLGVHMLVIRELWTPETQIPQGGSSRGGPTWQPHPFYWSLSNKVRIAPLEAAFDDLADASESLSFRVARREPLPWGQKVYAVSGFKNKDYGMNVTFARCDQGQEGKLIKSIVHKPDGHGYRNWDHSGDILY